MLTCQLFGEQIQFVSKWLKLNSVAMLASCACYQPPWMLLVGHLHSPFQVKDAQQKDILEQGDPELANPKMKGLGYDYLR